MTSTEAIAAILTYCVVHYGANANDVTVITDEPGYGRTGSCDDSDSIVTVQYNNHGHKAVFGILDDEPEIWMD